MDPSFASNSQWSTGNQKYANAGTFCLFFTSAEFTILLQNSNLAPHFQTLKIWCHISTIRSRLHSEKIVKRIHFKQCMLVYRSLHGMAPSYIADMCVKRSFESERYNLRSAVRGELVVPLARKSTLGRRSFKYSGPSLWNALSHDIRDSSLTFSQFRSGLKTLLYREAYYP